MLLNTLGSFLSRFFLVVVCWLASSDSSCVFRSWISCWSPWQNVKNKQHYLNYLDWCLEIVFWTISPNRFLLVLPEVWWISVTLAPDLTFVSDDLCTSGVNGADELLLLDPLLWLLANPSRFETAFLASLNFSMTDFSDLTGEVTELSSVFDRETSPFELSARGWVRLRFNFDFDGLSLFFAALARRYDLLVVLNRPDSVRDGSLDSGSSSISEYETDSSASEESSAKRAELKRVLVFKFQMMPANLMSFCLPFARRFASLLLGRYL